jgi:hypothetical protein
MKYWMIKNTLMGMFWHGKIQPTLETFYECEED